MGKVKDYYTIAQEVIDGYWGNGSERKDRLEAAGYDYSVVQNFVNKILYGEDETDELVVHFDTTKYNSIKVILE